MDDKIRTLDGLRGYMSLWVFFTHVLTMATLTLDKHQGWGWILANGEFAVGVFIILSGFVITLNLQREQTVSDFYLRRALRLFPAYLVCLAFSVLILPMSIELLRNFPWEAMRLDDRIAYLENSQKYFYPHLVAHVALLHGLIPERLLPSTSFAFMGQAWSLTLEWQYYIIAPLIFWLQMRIRPQLWLMALAVLFGTLVARRMTQGSFILSFLWLFLIGAYFAQCMQARLRDGKGPSLILVTIVMTAVAAVRREMAVPVVIFGACLWATSQASGSSAKSVVKALCANPIALFLGRISYGFYCFHMVAIFVAAWFLIRVLGVEARWTFAAILVPLSLTAAIAGAYLLCRLVEEPAIDLGRRLVGARRRARERQLAVATDRATELAPVDVAAVAKDAAR